MQSGKRKFFIESDNSYCYTEGIQCVYALHIHSMIQVVYSIHRVYAHVLHNCIAVVYTCIHCLCIASTSFLYTQLTQDIIIGISCV